MKTIIICGGHLSPTLPIIENLKKGNKYKIFYIGRRKALEGDKSDSLEYITINKIGIPFITLICGRFQRSFTRYTLLSLFKFPISLIQSLVILQKLKPDLVVSFGSYVALPVCIIARLLKVPIIIHEQTYVMGLTNRIVSRFASKICISWKDTQGIPKNAIYEITGNPNLFESHIIVNNNLVNFGNRKIPLIYITGGSLGSKTVNNVIGNILNELTKKYRIIHQTGIAEDGLEYNKLFQLRKLLPEEQKNNYQIYPFIDPYQSNGVFQGSSLVISRAGANTVSELKYYGVPSILIPLPWAADNEQMQNALKLEKSGFVIIINESYLTPQLLMEKIEMIMNNYKLYQKKANIARMEIKINATSRITEIIKSIC